MASTLQAIPQAGGTFEPRAILVGLAFAFILLIFAQSIFTILAATAFIVVPMAMANVSARWILPRLGIMLASSSPFLLAVPIFTETGGTIAQWGRLRITDAGLQAAAVLLFRATAITLWVLYMLATTKWAEGVHAARRLGLPRDPAAILILAHRQFHMLHGELNRIRIAVRTRGFRNRMDRHSCRTIGHLIGGLFVRGFDRSEKLHRAMLMRGFTGDLPSLRRTRFRRRDGIFILAACLFHSFLLIREVLLS